MIGNGNSKFPSQSTKDPKDTKKTKGLEDPWDPKTHLLLLGVASSLPHDFKICESGSSKRSFSCKWLFWSHSCEQRQTHLLVSSGSSSSFGGGITMFAPFSREESHLQVSSAPSLEVVSFPLVFFFQALLFLWWMCVCLFHVFLTRISFVVSIKPPEP